MTNFRLFRLRYRLQNLHNFDQFLTQIWHKCLPLPYGRTIVQTFNGEKPGDFLVVFVDIFQQNSIGPDAEPAVDSFCPSGALKQKRFLYRCFCTITLLSLPGLDRVPAEVPGCLEGRLWSGGARWNPNRALCIGISVWNPSFLAGSFFLVDTFLVMWPLHDAWHDPFNLQLNRSFINQSEPVGNRLWGHD